LISIGSNLDKERNLPAAIDLLRTHPELTLLAVSPLYSTEPIGSDGRPTTQPLYHNAAVRVATDLDAPALHAVLRTIEEALGRIRTADKFAPRTIDLDLAYYGRDVVAFEGRRIPERDVLRFAHVAIPLAAVAPDWTHPETGATLSAIAARLIHPDTQFALE
jgi:2-amino-4-hydroxy-6-hydroxymethyldihydropteridine diphosphokinase